MRGTPVTSLLGLAPGGRLPEPPFREAGGLSPPHATSRWRRWALTPPFHPCLAPKGLRRSCFCGPTVGCLCNPLGVTQRPPLWSPDFPPPKRERLPGPLIPGFALILQHFRGIHNLPPCLIKNLHEMNCVPHEKIYTKDHPIGAPARLRRNLAGCFSPSPGTTATTPPSSS